MSNKTDLNSIKGVDLSEEALDGATGGGGYKPSDMPVDKGQEGKGVAKPTFARTKEVYSGIIFRK